MIDYYQMLEIDDYADDGEIRKAYRAKCKQYHPDRVNCIGDKLVEVAKRETSQINRAYDILGNPERRDLKKRISDQDQELRAVKEQLYEQNSRLEIQRVLINEMGNRLKTSEKYLLDRKRESLKEREARAEEQCAFLSSRKKQLQVQDAELKSQKDQIDDYDLEITCMKKKRDKLKSLVVKMFLIITDFQVVKRRKEVHT